MLRKNTAGQFVYFAGVNATTGAALTGATFSCRRALDGTFAAATGSITEDTGLGLYKMALSQADTNGNNCGYFFTATNAVPVCLTVITTALDPTSTAFGLSIAKTTNITGFNDIAAPTGFAAATFPTGTIANTTNITAGTLTTVTTATNVTTVNGLAAGVITAASIAADAITDAKVAADVTIASVTGAVGSVTGAVGSVTGAVGSVTGNVGGNVAGSVGSVTAGVTVTTNNDKTGYALTAAEEVAIADALLGRNVSGGSSAGRTVKQALHVLRNKTDITAGTLTVYDTDDVTSSFTAAVTTTAGDPISQIDPA